MKYLAAVMVAMTIIFLQVRPLVRQKYYKEIAVYFILMSSGTAGILMQMAGIKIPSPAKGIELIVRTFVNINFGFQ